MSRGAGNENWQLIPTRIRQHLSCTGPPSNRIQLCRTSADPCSRFFHCIPLQFALWTVNSFNCSWLVPPATAGLRTSHPLFDSFECRLPKRTLVHGRSSSLSEEGVFQAVCPPTMAHSCSMAMGLASYESLQISKKCTDTRNGSVQTGILAMARFGTRSREEVAAIQFSSVRRWQAGAIPLTKAPIQKRNPSKLVICSLPVPPSGSSVQIASTMFTLGTAFVVPFYTAMIVAPKSKWTKKLVESDFPFVVLGAMYIFLLYLSWTPETLGLMFASKYLLPELPGITRMFSSTITVASAWLHLLVADLFCGRYVFLDGLQHKVETRHSLVLCLMMCPIGIVSHVLTKVISSFARRIDGESTTEIGAVLA